MDVDRRLRWVIEAKKPGEISNDDREQAYSYAMHPEVRAVIFAVITGTHFEFYYTAHKAGTPPLLAFRYDELSKYIHALKNLLSPDSLRRDFPDFVLDVGMPLAPGLRSFAKIEKGTMTYKNVPSDIPGFAGIVVHINDGSLVRVPGGGIMIVLKPSLHHENLNAFLAAIKAKETVLCTKAEVISSDPHDPTIFSQDREIDVEKGTEVPDPGGSVRTSPAPVSAHALVSAELKAYIEGAKIFGLLIARAYVPAADRRFEVVTEVELSVR